MTPQEIALVRTSFERVVPIRRVAAAIFYERLFALDPGLRPMFATADMEKQGTKLMTALAFVVRGLTDLDRIVPHLQDLGRIHTGYGVKPAHYDTVGQALIVTLAQAFGDDFTPDLKSAWTSAYGLVAATMMKGAAADRAAA